MALVLSPGRSRGTSPEEFPRRSPPRELAPEPAPEELARDPNRPLLVVGRVGRPHGLAGEMGVRLVGDDPERLAAGRELWLEKEGRVARRVRVTARRAQPPRFLLRFEGVDTREEARDLTGGDLCVPFDPADVSAGEYYPHQLQGLMVRSVAGERVGTVRGVVFAPGREFLEVEAAGESRTRLVPFHGDIVKEVDLAAGHVTIDPPEGLLEL